MNRVVALVLSLLISAAFPAERKENAITVLAPVTCADWIKGRKEKTEVKPLEFSTAAAMNEFWLLGLLSGMNAGLGGPNLLSSVDSTLVFDWMDRYCTRKPTASVFAGAEDLLAEVARRLKR